MSIQQVLDTITTLKKMRQTTLSALGPLTDILQELNNLKSNDGWLFGGLDGNNFIESTKTRLQKMRIGLQDDLKHIEHLISLEK